jgi:hypothetical protein
VADVLRILAGKEIVEISLSHPLQAEQKFEDSFFKKLKRIQKYQFSRDKKTFLTSCVSFVCQGEERNIQFHDVDKGCFKK